jgi:hypothetical protein
MSATITSLIRTYVPIVVGSLVAWLITLGVVLDPTVEAGLITALTGVLIAVYYTVVRLLEKRWPALGILLGAATAPTYVKPVSATWEADVQAASNDRTVFPYVAAPPVPPVTPPVA